MDKFLDRIFKTFSQLRTHAHFSYFLEMVLTKFILFSSGLDCTMYQTNVRWVPNHHSYFGKQCFNHAVLPEVYLCDFNFGNNDLSYFQSSIGIIHNTLRTQQINLQSESVKMRQKSVITAQSINCSQYYKCEITIYFVWL